MQGKIWKIQNIYYKMGTKIFKIEEEMTEKMKPKVANPPPKKWAKYWSFYSKKQECKFALPIIVTYNNN